MLCPIPWSPGCRLQAQASPELGWAAAAGTRWLRPGFEARTAAGAPHLRVVEAEPDRPCQGHPAVHPPAPGRPPSPGRPCFRPFRQRRPPGPGGGAPRSRAPSRAARRRLGRRVFELGLELAGCTAVPGSGGLGLIRRWTRSLATARATAPHSGQTALRHFAPAPQLRWGPPRTPWRLSRLISLSFTTFLLENPLPHHPNPQRVFSKL